MGFRTNTKIITIVVVLIALSGCSGLIGGGSGTTPDQTVEQYLKAGDNGNVQKANSYLANNSEVEKISQADAAELEKVDISIDNVTTVSQGNGTATVMVTYTVEKQLTTQAYTYRYELVDTEKGWKIQSREEITE